MRTRKTTGPRFAICIENSEYPASLEMHKIYRVLPDNVAKHDDLLRVVDESGEDYLYPADYFVLIGLPQNIARSLNKFLARSAHHAGGLLKQISLAFV